MSETKVNITNNGVHFIVSLNEQESELNLELISLAEEKKLRQRFSDLPEKNKEEAEHLLNVETLLQYSLGESKQSVKEFFAEKTIGKERMADFAVRTYLLAMQPTITSL